MKCIWLGALLLGSAAFASAADDGWTFEVGGERADITLQGSDTAWWAGRAQLSHQRERGGAFLSVESQHRYDKGDVVVAVGGHRHWGRWTLAGRAGVTPRAEFYYRVSAESEVSRRIVGTWVGSAGYRYLDFSAARVHLVSVGLARYARWGHVEGRATLGENTTRDTGSSSFLLRASWEVAPRLRLGAGAAVGERLFDVTSLAGDPARGFIIFATTRLDVSERDGVGLDIRLAHENPSFDQLAVGLSYRRAF